MVIRSAFLIHPQKAAITSKARLDSLEPVETLVLPEHYIHKLLKKVQRRGRWATSLSSFMSIFRWYTIPEEEVSFSYVVGSIAFYKRLSTLDFLEEMFSKIFSFGDLLAVIKHTQTSRKVRKYSKGKFRFRSHLTRIRPRCDAGWFYKLAYLATVASNKIRGLRRFIKFVYFTNLAEEHEDLFQRPEVTQLVMLDRYVKHSRVS